MVSPHQKLTRSFYRRDVLSVARDLLGKYLVIKTHDAALSAKIVEVEAYGGKFDQAAHSFKGKTPRNSVMFNEGGFFYVYFTYGNHFCCNVVTGHKDEGFAVLIRAVEPIMGIEQMAFNRYGRRELKNSKELYNLTSGPGKLCKALNIGRKENGLDLTKDYISITRGEKIPMMKRVETIRVGINKSTGLPWRFYVKNNPFVSGK